MCCCVAHYCSSFSFRLECDEVCDIEERNRLVQLLVVNLHLTFSLCVCVCACMCAAAFYSEPMLY